ncbi:MetQ/NlpA family ABC transporter substrate-binding protein [Helicobacter mustelae]|uniref:Putative outer membrane lipoprotein n=1 Tax=Helicobacter mustelae (strain ATCC 43772 / CCUG 25715 / CIP 103759 / LMG 18044 / NCTC 12198 / R85-136P) TaxID=679897 RepID=D3UJH0_HELM1|nr:MetQ/NlpA family ABC transporter substrate-binding protein [Helicobacter mustelae]CBG40646.1 putative outer membrane lipoprotein [Helicobacter mustelae 12198]SQH72144.1 ABC transporter substrate-binding protein [Helicobacter mustelae]STP13289.1 ABC transporter substrate-binding protein [Helicobacter mustelae]
MKVFKFFLLLVALTFAACNNNQAPKNILRVGATPVPHAEVLEFIKPQLARKGISLEVVVFNDYITPNTALNDKSIDANLFQHLPFLQKQIADRKYDLVASGPILLVPLGIYSNKIHNLDELGQNDVVSIPNDPSNLARALILLDSLHIIKLIDPNNLNATEQDIIENPKKLKLVPLEAPMLAQSLKDVVISIVPGNFSLQAKLQDPLAQESRDNPYPNVVATRRDNQNDPKIKALLEALHSKETRDHIQSYYKGAVLVY